MLIKLITILLIVIGPFLMVGVIRKVKAFWARRKGQRLLQGYYDFVKLLRKNEVGNAGEPIKIFPDISLAALLSAALLVPYFGSGIFEFKYDFILFVALLGSSRFFSALNAMQYGSSFEGMGTAREMAFSVVVEPGYYVVIGTFACVGQLGITKAYICAPAREISVYDYTQVIFAAALGFLVFGDIPDLLSVVGYDLICGAGVAMFFYNKKRA